MAELGTIKQIEDVYKITKEYIVYDSFQTLLVAIIIFLMMLRFFDEYQKNINEHKFDPAQYWSQIKIYVLVCAIVSLIGPIFNLIESIMIEVQDGLIKTLGGDVASKAWDSFTDVWNRQESKITAKELEDKLLGDQIFIIRWIMKGLAAIIAGIGIFILKYTYTFFIMGRYMWLLMLETVAPVAIVLMFSETTRSYFITWVKNMFICYLLIPFFLLADKFSNELGLAFVKDAETAGSITILLAICASVWVKVKMFSVVRSKSSQLF